MTHFSNKDDILETKEYFITLILFLLTIVIILFGFLIFSAISYFPSIQHTLVDMFTSLGVVLAFFAIALSIGYSTDSSITIKKLQKETNEIKKEIENNNQKLQDLINNSNNHFEHTIKNNNLIIEQLIERNNRNIDEIDINLLKLKELSKENKNE